MSHITPSSTPPIPSFPIPPTHKQNLHDTKTKSTRYKFSLYTIQFFSLHDTKISTTPHASIPHPSFPLQTLAAPHSPHRQKQTGACSQSRLPSKQYIFLFRSYLFTTLIVRVRSPSLSIATTYAPGADRRTRIDSPAHTAAVFDAIVAPASVATVTV